MKLKITLGFLVFVLSFPLFSQTIVWEEDFKTGQGWFIEDNWLVEGSNLQFVWSPQLLDFDVQALSPIVHLNENVEELIVTQYLDVFGQQSDETAEITLVLENEEVVLWSYVLEGGNWGNQSGSEIAFPISDYAGMDVRFKFRAFGEDSFNWNWWGIYGMKVTANFDYDLAAVGISGQHSMEVNEPGFWSVDVQNMGNSSMTNYTVKLFCYNTGTLIGSIDEAGSIASKEIKSYLFEWSSDLAYNTVFYGVIESVNDEFNGNNGSESYFVRIAPDIEYSVMVWDHDNGIQTVVDPEKGDLIRSSTGLTRALDNAGIEYLEYTYLPNNLNDFDVVFSTMGSYCVD